MQKHRFQKIPVEIKNSILDSILTITLIVGSPALVMAIINNLTIAHFPYFSSTGFVIVVIFIIFRKKIPFYTKAWSIIIAGYSIGTVSLINEGILSDGLIYYIQVSLIASMLVNIRSGLIISSVCLTTASLIAYAVSKTWIQYDFEISEYFYSVKTWISFIAMTAYFSALSIYVYGRIEYYLDKNISEITQKSRNLARSKKKLEKEILERKHTEKQLTESEQKFKNVFNSIADGIVLLREDNTVIEVNDSFLKMTKLPDNKTINKPLHSFFSDPKRMRSLLKSGSDSSTLFNLSEQWLRKAENNDLIPVEVRIIPLQYESDIYNIAVIEDITEKKESDIRVMHAVINSEEEERKRVAQDLHDGLGPYLSAAKLYTNSLIPDENDVKGHEIKYELNELLGLCIGSIREIAENLGAHVLRLHGLHAALLNFINKINLDNAITFSLLIPKDIKLIEQVETALFRIMVELINNSVKYGNASTIIIKHTENHRNIQFEYNENGVGFNVKEVLKHQKGMGLYNIHSRIHSLGGLLEYHSSPGKGVHVKITFNRNRVCNTTPTPERTNKKTDDSMSA